MIRLDAVPSRNKPLMKSNMLLAILLPLFLVTAGYAQTLDKAKLDQLFDRLLEKNKGMGSLTLAKDGNVLYSRSFGYSQINGTEKKLSDCGDEIQDRLDHKNVYRRDDLPARRRKEVEAHRHA